MKTPYALYALIIAALVALAFPPAGVWPLIFPAFVFFFYLIFDPKKSRREQMTLFYFYSLGVNVFGFYWVTYLFHEFGGMSWWLSIPLGLFSLALASTPALLAGYLLWWVFQLKKELHWRYLIAFALVFLWDSFEPRFFPWFPAMAVGSDDTLLASVGIFGSGGWRLILFSLSFYGAFVLRQRLAQRDVFYRLLAAYSFVLALSYGAGLFQKSRLQDQYRYEQPVAVLQGNVGNFQKKLSKKGVRPTIQVVSDIYENLIEEASMRHADNEELSRFEAWFLWPETSYPGHPLERDFLKRRLDRWIEDSRALHLIGGYERGKLQLQGKDFHVDYNIVALFRGDKEKPKDSYQGHYQKRIRVAFGEYIPGDKWFPELYDLLPAVNHFGAGEDFVPLPHPDPKGPVFLPVVCYELLFDSFVDDFVAKARQLYPNRDLVLLNPSNDSWYGPTSEPFQNAHLSRWQAARQGLPLLRPTNTGLSQLVAPWGQVTGEAPRDEEWVLYGGIPLKNPPIKNTK